MPCPRGDPASVCGDKMESLWDMPESLGSVGAHWGGVSPEREREKPGVCDSGHPKPQPLRGGTVKEFRVVLRLPGLLVAPCWGPGWTLAQGRVGSGLCGEMAWAGIPIEGCHGLGDPHSKGEREFVFGRKLWD